MCPSTTRLRRCGCGENSTSTRFEQALNVIVARHEVLRTTIETVDEQPVAVVHENWPLRLKKIDLSGLAADQRQAEVERLLIDEPRRPYHLEAEPGIRATLLQLGPREHVFILMMHHIVCDWSSEGVLWRELSALYRAFFAANRLPCPPCRSSTEIMRPGSSNKWPKRIFPQTLLFGRRTSAGRRRCWSCRPIVRGRPFVPIAAPNNASGIDATLAAALRDFSRREQTSPFTVFAAAFNTLLYRYTGQEDILVGIPMADRDRPELQSVIGFLLHTHVLRTAALRRHHVSRVGRSRSERRAGALQPSRRALRPGCEQGSAEAQPELLPAVPGDAQLARSRPDCCRSSGWKDSKSSRSWPRPEPRSST